MIKLSATQKIVSALTFIALMYLSLGFAIGINSFLIPVLQGSFNYSSGLSYLIIAATFSTFILFGYPAALCTKKIGYKYTMALSFLFFAMGFGVFMFSTRFESFILFLLASFVSGIGNTFLQAAVNPYVTILGPIESGAKRISMMGILNKLGWAIAPVFLALVIGKSVNETSISDLYLPFMIIIVIFILLGIATLAAPLPEIKAVGEDESSVSECPYAASKHSIWQFPHLILGAVTLFIYVGVETIALSTAVDYANYIQLPHAASYAWIASIGMVAGYICGVLFIPKYLSQSAALKICSILGILGSIAILIVPLSLSIWAIGLMALGCSLMWPAIWPLAMTDLGRFTKTGSSLLVMSIAGGAVIPTAFGFLKDHYIATGAGMQTAYWICLPCFVLILLYGLYGYKIRTK